jgi:hypothetical protein
MSPYLFLTDLICQKHGTEHPAIILRVTGTRVVVPCPAHIRRRKIARGKYPFLAEPAQSSRDIDRGSGALRSSFRSLDRRSTDRWSCVSALLSIACPLTGRRRSGLRFAEVQRITSPVQSEAARQVFIFSRIYPRYDIACCSMSRISSVISHPAEYIFAGYLLAADRPRRLAGADRARGKIYETVARAALCSPQWLAPGRLPAGRNSGSCPGDHISGRYSASYITRVSARESRRSASRKLATRICATRICSTRILTTRKCATGIYATRKSATHSWRISPRGRTWNVLITWNG